MDLETGPNLFEGYEWFVVVQPKFKNVLQLELYILAQMVCPSSMRTFIFGSFSNLQYLLRYGKVLLFWAQTAQVAKIHLPETNIAPDLNIEVGRFLSLMASFQVPC